MLFELAGVDPVVHAPPTLPRRIYSEAVREALIVLWEAADRICGKRLKAILPGLIWAWSGPAIWLSIRSSGNTS